MSDSVKSASIAPPEATLESKSTKTSNGSCQNFLTYCNVSKLLTQYFTWHGRKCAEHPFKVITVTFGLICLFSLGMLNFHWESNAIKLWIPSNSDFATNYEYLWSKYPPDLRFHSVLFVAPEHDPDILQPKYIQQMYKVYKSLQSMQFGPRNLTWSDSCFRIPIVKVDLTSLAGKRRRKRQDFSEFGDYFISDEITDLDPSIEFYPSPYCKLVEGFTQTCFEQSILELWAKNGAYTEESDELIANLSKEDILDKVNRVNTSGLFLIERDFQSLLGNVQRDEKGRIVSATATEFKLIGLMNGTAARLQDIHIDNALGEYVEQSTLDFEGHLIKLLLKSNGNEVGLQTLVNVARSFNDIASETILTDISMVIVGFMIVFVYVIFMLGKFDMVKNRAILSLLGLSSVSMTIFASYGICCTLGFAFSPLHNFIPFLLLGLGIDDMFVIMQSLNNLENEPEHVKEVKISKVIARALGRSGVAITVTSLTDVLAFGVGATTVLPALQSFCLFCGVGIFLVYMLQATWFVAWLTLDQKRIEANRNGFLPCYKHSVENAIEGGDVAIGESQDGIAPDSIFYVYGIYLLKWPTQIFVLISTSALLAVSLWGNYELRQEFDPMWFLPKESYLSQWNQMNEKFFPSQGEKIHIFFTDTVLPEELAKLDHVVTQLHQQPDIITSVDSWYTSFKDYYDTYLSSKYGPIFNITKNDFEAVLTQYLYSPKGSKYRMMFKYEKPISCGQPAPNILMFTMELTHRLFSGPKEQVPAMNRVKAIVKEANFSGTVFPFSKGYAAWETDEIIAMELYRNLGLALGCITLTTMVLLSDWLGCLQVVGCVLLTLTNVAGFMHFWGLTIETVSSTNLIISIGLCVDCPAHIAHEFLATKGSRYERTCRSLANMGPAVLNGGFSTFLSFILLANSDSHVFETFFKIFFLVVVFALYNGLVVLPIILHHFGPNASSHFTEEKFSKSEQKGEGEETELKEKMLT